MTAPSPARPTRSTPTPLSAPTPCGSRSPTAEASSLADPLQITVGNRPTATIDAPADGSTFRAGDVIAYRGSGSDLEDGALPATAFSWRGLMRHETHSHPFFGPVDDVSGGFVLGPDDGS